MRLGIIILDLITLIILVLVILCFLTDKNGIHSLEILLQIFH